MMKTIEKFLELCRDSIQEKLPENIKEKYKDVDWGKMYTFCKYNHVGSICYHVAEQAADSNEELLETWKNELFGSGMMEILKLQSLQDVLKKAKERGITLVTFKGCVLSDLYPQFTMRISSDSDLYVPESQREEAVKLLLDCGYEQNMEKSKDMVPVFRKKQHTIELHYCLWEDYTGGKMNILENCKLTDPASLVQLNVCGIDVLTLGYTEHLIFQMFHIIKHFIVQGVSFRYLMDITLYVNRYIEKLDTKRFWNSMEELGYDRFCEVFFQCCQQYLGMARTITVGRQDAEQSEIQVLLAEIIQLEQRDQKDAYQLLGIMTSYLTGTRKAADKKWKRKLQVLFPDIKSLSDNYMYAKKCPVLLPIAWIHRGILFVFKHQKHKENWYNTQEKLSVAEYRIALLEKLHLSE